MRVDDVEQGSPGEEKQCYFFFFWWTHAQLWEVSGVSPKVTRVGLPCAGSLLGSSRPFPALRGVGGC